MSLATGSSDDTGGTYDVRHPRDGSRRGDTPRGPSGRPQHCADRADRPGLPQLGVVDSAHQGRARPADTDRPVRRRDRLEPGLTYLLFDLGVARTAASHAALLLALDAPVTLALAVAFLRERVDRALLISLALGVTGSALVTWRTDATPTTLLGDVLVVASTVTAAAYAVLARHVAPTRDPVVVTAVQLGAALVVALPVFATSLARGQSQLASADSAHLGLAVVIGLLGGVIPFLLFNRAISEVTASRASLLGVLVPVVGAGLSVLVLSEPVTAPAVAGGVLALLAAVVAARRPDRER